MKKEQSFLVPIPREILLSANLSLNHRVKAIKARYLRELGYLIGDESRQYLFSKYTVDVIVYSPSKRRLDPPNLYPTVKHVIDGLTDANIWEDDDYTHMTKMSFSYGGLSELPDTFILKIIIKGDVMNETS